MRPWLPTVLLLACPGPVEAPPAAHAPSAAPAPRAAAAPGEARQVLFGDLHAHSTWSMDAFALAVPMMGGLGVRPPADACDYARWCSSLDFFAMTDHAESLTAEHWAATKDAMRRCAARSGDPRDPDLVPFVGFEWTQVGATAAQHYGHRNVLFRDLAEADLPKRPIAAGGLAQAGMKAQGVGALKTLGAAVRGLPDLGVYQEMLALRTAIVKTEDCPDGVPVRELPADCRETAETPRALFGKLDDWGLDALVIPHGTTWGFYTPPGASWTKGLSADQQDPERQRLIEVFSGHGSAEEHRPWRDAERDAQGGLVCPEPSEGYEPCCWRAGEIVRSRCGDLPTAACDALAGRARRDYLSLGSAGFRAVPGATAEDWGACGVCRDCYAPAMNHRPAASVQAILAGAAFDDEGEPSHATFGLLASSDNHGAAPGTGFKEVGRSAWTDARGPVSRGWMDFTYGDPGRPRAESHGAETLSDWPAHQQVFAERQSSFFGTGGLVAVHSEGRSRDAVWAALRRREVYGTSGPRILLWFDLLGDDGERHPMGSEVAAATPRFEVRALGALEQVEGCALPQMGGPPADIAARLCLGECYRPGEERVPLDRIEVVRIRRQQTPGEDLADLIEDPWRTFACPEEGPCVVQFDDPDPPGPEALYYVRALQRPTPTINLAGVRCEGADCDVVRPCYGDFRTPDDDDCLAMGQERAWSSPVFVTVDDAR